jgi:NADP-dependent 3-hydroxy acid dehydrogenase YdfG
VLAARREDRLRALAEELGVPAHVLAFDVNRIELMSVMQSFAGFAVKRS